MGGNPEMEKHSRTKIFLLAVYINGFRCGLNKLFQGESFVEWKEWHEFLKGEKILWVGISQKFRDIKKELSLAST